MFDRAVAVVVMARARCERRVAGEEAMVIAFSIAITMLQCLLDNNDRRQVLKISVPS